MQIERDPSTRMAYATAATWAFFLYFLGPATPLIADQLGVPLQLAGLTGVALAAGLVLSGLVGPTVIARWGRRVTGIYSSVGLAAGALILAFVPGFAAVLAAVLLASATGSMLMNVATAALADRHGPAGPRAITEANAVAAWVGLTAPLIIGATVALGLGWRAAAVVIAAVALMLAAGLSRVHLTERPGVGAHPRSQGPDNADPGPLTVEGVAVADTVVAAPVQAQPRAPLPRRFYISLIAVVAAVGTEISLNFWGAVLITQNTGADLAVTTASVSVLIAGIALGRTLGSSLTRRFTVPHLIYASLGLAGAGFMVVWFAPLLSLAITGLLLTGLGFALLFPLTSSLAIGHARGQADRAIALIAVTIGVTMGVAPFLLGALAGVVGVTAGFAIVPVLLVVGVFAIRGATPPAKPPAGPLFEAPAPHTATTRHGG